LIKQLLKKTMVKCPNCKLINPAGSERCDCGYDFSSGEIKDSYVRNVDGNAIPANLLLEKKQEAGVWLAAAFGALALAIATRFTDWHFIYWLVVLFIYIPICCMYAKCKGYSGTYGLFGFLSVIGLLILISKPYKTRSKTATEEPIEL
jgi:hypothetical protein